MRKVVVILGVVLALLMGACTEDNIECNCSKEGRLYELYEDGTRVEIDYYQGKLIGADCSDDGTTGITRISRVNRRDSLTTNYPATYLKWEIICK